MDNQEIQKKCEAMLKELGIPSFIVFGFRKTDSEFGIVSSFHDMPPSAVAKGLSWALHDYLKRTMI